MQQKRELKVETEPQIPRMTKNAFKSAVLDCHFDPNFIVRQNCFQELVFRNRPNGEAGLGQSRPQGRTDWTAGLQGALLRTQA
jgi:hypothetical protein